MFTINLPCIYNCCRFYWHYLIIINWRWKSFLAWNYFSFDDEDFFWWFFQIILDPNVLVSWSLTRWPGIARKSLYNVICFGLQSISLMHHYGVLKKIGWLLRLVHIKYSTLLLNYLCNDVATGNYPSFLCLDAFWIATRNHLICCILQYPRDNRYLTDTIYTESFLWISAINKSIRRIIALQSDLTGVLMASCPKIVHLLMSLFIIL